MNALGKIVLIGVGLIGGSLMLDLKRRRQVGAVVGIDINADNLARALERRVIDEAYTEITADNIAQADLVILATPVATLPSLCRLLLPHLPPHTVVSDVGSTKQSALAAFAQYLPQHFPRCVAAHPIAGSDRSGALAAQFGLYQGKKLIVQAACTWWKTCGAAWARKSIRWMRPSTTRFLPPCRIFRICWRSVTSTKCSTTHKARDIWILPAAVFAISRALPAAIRKCGRIFCWRIGTAFWR